MALIVKDRVKETSTTTGTGTLTLAGASSGFQSFGVIGDGNTTYYAAVDLDSGDWEVGIGTYASSGTTLSRDTILESSNSNAAVDFSAGERQVFVTYPAEKGVYMAADDSVTFSDSVTVEGNLTVNGTTTTINAENLAVSDNMIYLRDGESTGHVDLGFGGNYNDGTYAHAGFFRDATDGRWKVFDGYTPELDAATDINTGHASFSLADIEASTFYGNLVGGVTGNVTGDVTGNADTATALETSRTISLTGDVTGSASFDGTANASITATVADDSHNHVISNVDGLQTALDAKVAKSGDSMTGNLTFGDNDKAIFGAGSDLQIYHDGSGSYIDDVGTGPLILRTGSGGTLLIEDSDGDDLIRAVSNSFVRLYHNNSGKLATTSTGIDVTGTVTADGLTVNANDCLFSGTAPSLLLEQTDVVDRNARFRVNGQNLNIQSMDDDLSTVITRAEFDLGTGDISFYEDTGTTAKFFWDASAERLGIGTTGPSGPLDITNGSTFSTLCSNSGDLIIQTTNTPDMLQLVDAGATSATNAQVYLEFSYASALGGSQTRMGYIGYGSTGDQNLNILNQNANGGIEFGTGDSEAMRIDSSGRLLVGSTSITSSLGAIATFDGSVFSDTENRAANPTFAFAHDNFSSDSNNYIMLDRTTEAMRFSVAGSERMRIDSGGNVGIDTNSPKAQLDVRGQVVLGNVGNSDITNLTSGTPPQLIAGWSAPAITWSPSSWIEAVVSRSGDCGMDILAFNAGSSILNFSDTDDEDVGQIEYDHASDFMRFRVNANERMRIDSNGNVGIGTTSPNNKLDVRGFISLSDGSNRAVIINNTADGSDTGDFIACAGGAASTSRGGYFRAFGNEHSTNAGQIAINTGSVAGSRASFTIGNGGENFRMESDGDFHANGDVIAYSTTISDERLKENIVGIDGALDKVSQLNGYTFNYKADGKISAGVIAQEVEKVLPEAVSEKELPLKADDGQEYKVVNYDALHGLMIEAIKELKAEVADLKSQLENK